MRVYYHGRVAWERVYTVNDWWDGPLLGVADVFGCPHIYELPVDTLKDDYHDTFVVSPIDPELLRLVLEDWEIWMRWRDASERGETTIATHPALPQDRPRHDELNQLIGSRLKVDLSDCKKLNGEFRGLRTGWDRGSVVPE
jgi:hypothetical protein